MGQPIVVTELRALRFGTVRFDLNRSLTGMSHERYTLGDTIDGDRPADELARRLFATGQVEAVHVYMSVVTVTLRTGGASAEGLKQVIENLYRFYPDTPEQGPVEPPPGPNPTLGPATPADAQEGAATAAS